MKFKKIITLILAISCLFAVTLTAVSCGNDFSSTEWYENTSKTQRGASYKSFGGNKFYAVDFTEATDISVVVATASGDLIAEVYLKETPDAPIYSVSIKTDESGAKTAKVTKGGEVSEITLTENYTDTVKIPAKGNYVIHLNGQNHAGSFSFDW